jgi:hypothetical protein
LINNVGAKELAFCLFQIFQNKHKIGNAKQGKFLKLLLVHLMSKNPIIWKIFFLDVASTYFNS